MVYHSPASPTISNIDNTLPQVGEKVIVYGNNLQETNKITLPGGIEVTDITSDEDGEWYSFIMPADVTESGSITSEGANGIAFTPAVSIITIAMLSTLMRKVY